MTIKLKESDYDSGITNIISKIKSRRISKDFLDKEIKLKSPKLDNVLYLGDEENRAYIRDEEQ